MSTADSSGVDAVGGSGGASSDGSATFFPRAPDGTDAEQDLYKRSAFSSNQELKTKPGLLMLMLQAELLLK